MADHRRFQFLHVNKLGDMKWPVSFMQNSTIGRLHEKIVKELETLMWLSSRHEVLLLYLLFSWKKLVYV